MGLIKKIQIGLHAVNPNFLFVFWLLALSVFYDYPALLLKRPQSVHHWRQADCASIALNYYQTGMHFFQPQTHNLTSDDNSSGYCATSEIPIGYYSIACLYKIFGYHDFIYRLVNTLIFLMGLFYLFKICQLLFKSTFWSTVTALFFFTSPVLVYYGNNFLTDSSALAFSFVAWYFFIKSIVSGRQKYYYFSMVFFLLAGAYKITALISLVTILCLFIAEFTGLFKWKTGHKIFAKPLYNVIPIVFVFIVVGSWVYFAKAYNNTHGTVYFSTGILPIWKLDTFEIQIILGEIRKIWLNQYFHVFSLLLLAGIFIGSLVIIKKANNLLMFINLTLFTGTLIYIILWFSAFKDHDYYTINLYIFLVFILLNFIWILKNHFLKFFDSSLVKYLFLGFLLFNIIYARNQMNNRYYGWRTEYPEYKDYHIITPFLRSIGIAPLDTVICLPDYSHFTLYLMNQRGWTECFGNNSDSISVANFINRGAKYLIINNDVVNRPYLKSFLKCPIGQFNKVKIYKLSKPVSATQFNQ